METIRFVNSASLLVDYILILAFALTVVSLFIAMVKKRPRLMLWSGVPLLFSICLTILGNKIVKSEFTRLANGASISVEVFPPFPPKTPLMRQSPEDVFREVMNNIYGFKRWSGSHPTDKHSVKVCIEPTNCEYLMLGKDSRDQHLYWVYYKQGTFKRMPLGFFEHAL